MKNADLQGLMAHGLSDLFDKQNAARDDARRSTNIRLAVVAIALFAGGIAWPSFTFIPVSRYFMAVSFPTVFALLWAILPRQRAKHHMTKNVNGAIAEAIGLAYEREVDGKRASSNAACITANTYGLLPFHSDLKLTDFWSGKIDQRHLEFFEVVLTKQTAGGGTNIGTRTAPVFQGIVLCFIVGKPFSGTTLLLRDGYYDPLFAGEVDTITINDRLFDRTAYVHPEFEDGFDVYSTDQVEARALIDPVYVEQLIRLEREYAGKSIRCLFHIGHCIVVINSGPQFESGAAHPRDDERMLEKTCQQINAITDLATSLVPGSSDDKN